MPFKADKISYRSTNSFSPIVLNYIDTTENLIDFYAFKPNYTGIEKAINVRENYPVNRKLLVGELIKQYQNLPTEQAVLTNIEALLDTNTFTICTAHQPNIFTGHLYFVYKILHAIELSSQLNKLYTSKKFIPVYYMGSEDADLEELGEVHVKGKKYQWQTAQKGAVGKMVIDHNFIEIIDGIAGQLTVEKFGDDIIKKIKNCYQKGISIEEATYKFVHSLFGHSGLVILLPNNANLKNQFSPIVSKELLEQFSEKAVTPTVTQLSKHYSVQAAGRNINLFYLKDNIRERIEADADGYKVINTNIFFSKKEIINELKEHPEYFSANVILRPLYQETILPNVAFIGGGGELAYWLELKNVFEKAKVFFPVLVLRNSFTIINKSVADTKKKLNITNKEIFLTTQQIINKIVLENTNLQLDVQDEKEEFKNLYEKLKHKATAIDSSLNCHVHALRTQHLNKLEILEKKMLKAEKKKYDAQQRQILKIKSALFPTGNLQERTNNILEYIAAYGIDFINTLQQHSDGVEQQFTILTEQ